MIKATTGKNVAVKKILALLDAVNMSTDDWKEHIELIAGHQIADDQARALQRTVANGISDAMVISANEWKDLIHFFNGARIIG